MSDSPYPVTTPAGNCASRLTDQSSYTRADTPETGAPPTPAPRNAPRKRWAAAPCALPCSSHASLRSPLPTPTRTSRNDLANITRRNRPQRAAKLRNSLAERVGKSGLLQAYLCLQDPTAAHPRGSRGRGCRRHRLAATTHWIVMRGQPCFDTKVVHRKPSMVLKRNQCQSLSVQTGRNWKAVRVCPVPVGS